MLHVLRSLVGVLKVQLIAIDNHFFRLHYRVTVVILLAFSTLVTSGQFFGDPMDCHFPDFPYKSLNTYCYVHSTFLVEKSINLPTGQRIPYPGVSGHTEEDQLKFYDYYQWIFLVLIVQALLFYIPHYIWKAWEGGRMKMLASELASPVLSRSCMENNIEPLVDYFCVTLHAHNSYAYKYFTCELLNLVNVVGQICFMNAFLGEDFAFYGIYVIMYNQRLTQSVKNPMERLFPKMTKCVYHKYGPSGSLENRDGICVLPQNFVNGKMYVFLWFWFHILALISLLVVLFRIITLISSSCRFYGFRSSSWMSCAKNNFVVFQRLKIGDWFLLHRLQQNINSLAYKELISHLAQRFDSGVSDA